MREQLLPALRAENPAIDDALTRLAAAAREWTEVIDAAAAPFARFPIECPALAAQPTAVRKRALALALEAAGYGYGSAHLEALDAIVTAPARGEVSLDGSGFRAVRSYDQLACAPGAATSTCTCASTIPGHQLRLWQPGDRMRPPRLKGHSRKLSDLYGDLKIPRSAREGAHVVVRLADGVIVWAEHLGPSIDCPPDQAGTFDHIRLCNRL